MSYRPGNSSVRDNYSHPQSRLKPQIKIEATDEGCPVIEESGTVCGETNSLNVFKEFRRMYDVCLRNLEGNLNGPATLKKLGPLKKLIDDLWEQNALLVETVEELENEATYTVSNLQDKLNKSCQKMSDYKDDIKHLVKIIQCFCDKGVFDPTGLEFKTFCCTSVFGHSVNKYPSKRDDRKSNGPKRKSSPSRNNYSSTRGREPGGKRYNNEHGNVNTQNVQCIKQPSLYCESSSVSNNFRTQSNLNCSCETCDIQSSCAPPVNINLKIGSTGICEDSECTCICSCTSFYPNCT